MKFLSVCSGIEAASVAWNPLGWFAWAFSEIEPFPCRLLAHHYPDTPNLGDMTNYKAWPDATIDLLCGGTPCQSYSIAGLRKGLDDPRGNLMLTFGAIAGKYRPRWLVWENVPGVLSSNEGRDFGTFLGMLGELGYGFAYRILDAQYAGVPQRRRRVFVVGYLGDWRPSAAVLFERHSLSGHPAPRLEARAGATCGTLGGASPGGGWRFGADEAAAGQLIPQAFGGNNSSGPIDISTALNASCSASGRMDFESETFIAHSLRADGFDASEDGTGRGTLLIPVAFSCKDHGADAGVIAPTLRAMTHQDSHANAGGQVAVAFAENSRAELRLEGGHGESTGALKTGGGKPGQSYPVAMVGMSVRRLTPRECERLQGFPDDYTLIPVGKRRKPAKDGPRYKALGNSWAVPVVRWIGERIVEVEALTQGEVAA